MSRKKTSNYQIAYLCNGKNPKCKGREGCYYGNPMNGIIGGCLHTRDVKYAKNRTLSDDEHPLEYPERFDKFTCGDEIRYYESLRYFGDEK